MFPLSTLATRFTFATSSCREGVVVKVHSDLTAFSVVAPLAEEEPVTPEAEAAAAAGPEVITAKKEEGEAAAPAAGGKGAALERKALPPLPAGKEQKK